MDIPEEDLAARGRSIFDQLRAVNDHEPAAPRPAPLEDPTGLTAGEAPPDGAVADDQPSSLASGDASTSAADLPRAADGAAPGPPGGSGAPASVDRAPAAVQHPAGGEDGGAAAVEANPLRPPLAADPLAPTGAGAPVPDVTGGAEAESPRPPLAAGPLAPTEPGAPVPDVTGDAAPPSEAFGAEGLAQPPEPGWAGGPAAEAESPRPPLAADPVAPTDAGAPVPEAVIGTASHHPERGTSTGLSAEPPAGDGPAPPGEPTSGGVAEHPSGPGATGPGFHVEPPGGDDAAEPAARPPFHVEPAGADGPSTDAAQASVVTAMAAPPRPVRPLPRIMAVANQKGGVGKTTTAVNLGAALAELGYRTLVVDLDPQGNATTGLGINARNLQVSAYDVLMRELPVEDAVEPTSVRNLFVVPATIDLAGAEIELVPAFSRELRLKRALEGVAGDFDFTLIDCPPSLGLLTVNALAAATEVVVPVQCEYYALEGLSALLRNVQLVQTNLNRALEVSTIVLTMYDARTKLAEQVANEVRAHFGNVVCRHMVPRTVRLSEAPSFGQPIIVFDPNSRGAIAYRELAKEVSGGTPQRVG